MNKLLTDYFYIFLHPFKIYDSYHSKEKIPLTFYEMMGISWIFKIIRTIYYFIGIHFLLLLVSRGLNEKALGEITHKKTFLYWVLVGVIFYPLILWFLSKFWIVIIRFFCVLYNKDGPTLKISTVCYCALTSQGLLVVPILGEILVPFAFFFFLFAGLKKSLGFTTLQAVLVLISPLFLFFLMIILSLAYLMLLLNMI